MKKEDRAAASELVAYWREHPHCGPGGDFYAKRNNWNAKQHVKEVLGIRRIGTKRFAPILAMANQLYRDQVEKPATDVRSLSEVSPKDKVIENLIGILLDGEDWDASRLADVVQSVNFSDDKRVQDLQRTLEKCFPVSQEPVPQRPARPHNGPSMGLLLSTELRDASTAHSQAAALFCHCPHCGGALRVNASVTKGGE